MDVSEEWIEGRRILKLEIKEENDIPSSICPEIFPVKVEPWTIDLNKIKSDSDYLDVKSESNCFLADSDLQSITNVKTERCQIKSDSENGTVCELVENVDWEEDTKEKAKHFDNNAIKNLYNIKHEEIEIKSEENYSDTALQSLKDEPDDSTSAETMNHSKLEHRMRQEGSKDKFLGLKHRSISDKQMFKCIFCNFKTISKSYLKTHQLKHGDVPEDQMFKCESCDYKTIFKQNLTKHFLVHKDIPEEQMFKCESCDYKTIYKHHLTKHLLKHKDIPEEQMFKCDWCEYKTGRKIYLKRHEQRKHTSTSKKYQCDSCDFKTSGKDYLARHQLRHKDIPEEQMFKCDLCDYNTFDKNRLKIHQLKHKGRCLNVICVIIKPFLRII